MRTAPRIHLSPFLSVPFATIVYALSGAVVGTSAFPSALVLLWGARTLLQPSPAAGRLLLFCLLAGGALYLFLFCGLLLTGLLMRAISPAVRPGTHRIFSSAGAFWMAMNGVQAIAARLFLPAVPGGYFPSVYYRLAGCRVGKDVWIVGATILDPHLVSIGDGTVIGGAAVISPHIAGGLDVTFGPIRIGRDCRIGAHSVICAGSTIGDGATVGIHAFLRKGSRVGSGSIVAAVGGLSPREVLEMEGRIGVRDRPGKRPPVRS
ncbi:MAG TPA: DapH/DapD/GlmU-related protein [bacterium]|nr:DapH/DapD/GlmU-related protein [bacterium]